MLAKPGKLVVTTRLFGAHRGDDNQTKTYLEGDQMSNHIHLSSVSAIVVPVHCIMWCCGQSPGHFQGMGTCVSLPQSCTVAKPELES